LGNNTLTVIGYVVRKDERIRRDVLPIQEQKHLATKLNLVAMKSVGYVPLAKGVLPTKEGCQFIDE
jgi:hypothetical protein